MRGVGLTMQKLVCSLVGIDFLHLNVRLEHKGIL